MVVTGAWPGFDGARLLADAQRLCGPRSDSGTARGKPPFERYVFLLRAVDDGQGGLEHRASTALMAPRARPAARRHAPAATPATCACWA